MTPGQIVQAALDSGARTSAYTFTGPTIFSELAVDKARLAKGQGLKKVFVTSALINEARSQTLNAAFEANPVRFTGRPPTPKPLPSAVWINPPNTVSPDPQEPPEQH